MAAPRTVLVRRAPDGTALWRMPRTLAAWARAYAGMSPFVYVVVPPSGRRLMPMVRRPALRYFRQGGRV